MIEIKKENWIYEIESWIQRLGSIPKYLVAQIDNSRSYEMNRRSIFKLENGRFAVIKENGCSCYISTDAEIELFPDLESAKACFEKEIYESESSSWKFKELE